MLRRSYRFFAASSSSSSSSSAGAASSAFDPFKSLDLPNNASREEVKQRYRELAMKYHPDSGTTTDTDKMEVINRAYNLLIKQGMVDQLRAASASEERAAAKAGSQKSGPQGSGNMDIGNEVDEDDAAQAATLDPTTERISEDGSSFVYLCRKTNKWVHRRTPLTKPRQPRYGTFQQEKQTLDLHDEIRKRQMDQQKHEQEQTMMAKRLLRAADDNLPFNTRPAIAIAVLLYFWVAYLTYDRVLGKKLVFDDKRDFFFNKRGHKRMVNGAYEELVDECNLAAEAAVLIFLAAALKTDEDDPVVAPSESQITRRSAYHWYMPRNNM